MKLAVIGLGLIGGSMALELKSKGFAEAVMGVDASEAHREMAIQLGLVDECLSLSQAVSRADLVILAVPVNQIKQLLPQVLDLISATAVVTDVGSTKASIVESVANHSKRDRYVPSHPMAGTEFSGPNAAKTGLFKAKAAVICDRERSSPDALSLIEKMYASLEMRLISMESKAHDVQVAYVSHLSHITSFVLASTVLDKERDADTIFNLASGGFESTVRLAKSSPEMWSPIFSQNKDQVIEALDAYMIHLKHFREALNRDDLQETRSLMVHANQIGRVLAEIGNRGTK